MESFHFTAQLPDSFEVNQNFSGDLIGLYLNFRNDLYKNVVFITDKEIAWSINGYDIESIFYSDIIEIGCSDKNAEDHYIQVHSSNNLIKKIPILNGPKKYPQSKDAFEFCRFLSRVAAEKSKNFNKGKIFT